jgi:hypothetical protein
MTPSRHARRRCPQTGSRDVGSKCGVRTERASASLTTINHRAACRQVHPSSESTTASRRITRQAAEPSRASAIRLAHDFPCLESRLETCPPPESVQPENARVFSQLFNESGYSKFSVGQPGGKNPGAKAYAPSSASIAAISASHTTRPSTKPRPLYHHMVRRRLILVI